MDGKANKNNSGKFIADPVCGIVIHNILLAQESVYKGKTYFFCSETCKAKFDLNPEKYIKIKNKETRQQ
ncbi:YHS domain-containing protein [Melioribacter sp. Ez-97]|uniref:YHS domain-containing protein n=1 Tax=Melioribacter sp. Ez-97 TaxID=3423434 RepID=UPI003EDAAB41